MSVLADSTHEEVYTARSCNLRFVCSTFCDKILGISVKDIDVLLRDIHMIEEVPRHERMIALRMFFRESYIFIHIEGYHIAEGNLSSLIHTDEFLICSYRSTSCRKSQNEGSICNGSLCLYSRHDVVCSPF